RRTFAGGPHRQQPARSLRDLPIHQVAERFFVERAVLERGDERGEGTSEARPGSHDTILRSPAVRNGNAIHTGSNPPMKAPAKLWLANTVCAWIGARQRESCPAFALVLADPLRGSAIIAREAIRSALKRKCMVPAGSPPRADGAEWVATAQTNAGRPTCRTGPNRRSEMHDCN